jgi:hypothetical protein
MSDPGRNIIGSNALVWPGYEVRPLQGHVPAAVHICTDATPRASVQPGLDDLDVPFVGALLADLGTKRGATVRTRNLRLRSIRHGPPAIHRTHREFKTPLGPPQ